MKTAITIKCTSTVITAAAAVAAKATMKVKTVFARTTNQQSKKKGSNDR